MNDDRLSTFRALHAQGFFVVPNPWDIGSATMLAGMGFKALATTSWGFATAIGLRDQQVTRDQLLLHAEALASAVDVPLNVDSERLFADDLVGVARTVELLAATGAAGCSIEDYDPATDTIDEVTKAAERVAAAAEAARRHGIVLTARAENFFYGINDLDDTIARLVAYRDAGADVLYAPGLTTLTQIADVIAAVERPINVLRLPTGPSLSELADAGVRRVSTGGALARTAYTAMRAAAKEILDQTPA
jgi:2-methylisocitrate lyase-like PEP mutase family enzyme